MTMTPDVDAPASPGPSWARGAAGSGVIAGVVGSSVLAGGYYLKYAAALPRFEWLPWSLSIVSFGLLSGLFIAVSICGGIVLARRRAALGVSGVRSNDIFGAAVGAVVGGLFPCLIGVVGYGSLTLPYAGTDLASATVFVTAMLLGGLCSLPAATERDYDGPRWRALALGFLAAALVVIPFGLTIAGAFTAELTLPVIREILYTIGGASVDHSHVVLGLFAGALSVLLGALFGSIIGVTTRLAALLRRVAG